MTLRYVLTRFAVSGLAALAVSTTAVADDKTTNTLLGAGLGAAAGAVLSEGDPMLTLGGAAAGGVLGNILTEDKKRYDRSHRRHYKGPKHNYGPKHHYANNKHYNRGHKKHHKKHRKHHRHHR